MMPLLPGFEGDVGAPGGSALQAVLHWTYLSLCRGPNSLFESLKKFLPDPSQYVHVGSLRTHDELTGRLVTELIYIHSKLIIVDDRRCLIGSANINDRSQAGNRDSEVALFFDDTEFEPSVMNGQPYEAGKFALSLRRHLMSEHLGLLDAQRDSPSGARRSIDVTDPVSDAFFIDIWTKTAAENTRIYEKVFRCYPTDQVSSFEELSVWVVQLPMARFNPSMAEDELKMLCGCLVEFPKEFLCASRLAPGFTSKEGLVPTAIFT